MESENKNKSCVYQICCNDLEIADRYIGSTRDLTKRENKHRSACNNALDGGYNTPVYQFIREHGGFANWKVVLIQYFPNHDRHELEQEERRFVEELKPTLNTNKVALTLEEKIEQQRNAQIEFLQRHPGYKKMKNCEFWKKHPDYNKQYYAEKKENFKQYYVDNKIRLNEKIQCECGVMYARSCKTQHVSTKKHKKLIATIINEATAIQLSNNIILNSTTPI